MEKLTEKQISRMVDELNCSSISNFMHEMNWMWFRAAEGVPSPQEVADEARRLLREANKFDKPYPYYIETGGLRAVNDGNGTFEIMFIAQRASVYVNEN